MIEKHIDVDFDVDEVSFKINNIMSKWSAHLIDMNGCDWIIYNYDMDIICLFHFQIDFNDLEMRIKLEDLKLNIIHHIESLRDETSYRDNLVNGLINQK